MTRASQQSHIPHVSGSLFLIELLFSFTHPSNTAGNQERNRSLEPARPNILSRAEFGRQRTGLTFLTYNAVDNREQGIEKCHQTFVRHSPLIDWCQAKYFSYKVSSGWLYCCLIRSLRENLKCEFIFSSNSSISFSGLNCINGIKGEVGACTLQAINLKRREKWLVGFQDRETAEW